MQKQSIRLSDPVKDVEECVQLIIDEHHALWGCDDPACAVRLSTYVQPPKKRSWWHKLFRNRDFER